MGVSARMTWVLTLMPITLLSDNIIQRAVIQHSVIVVEIARRSMWSILRIEHEQVANSSGYRALLWVPEEISAAPVGKEACTDIVVLVNQAGEEWHPNAHAKSCRAPDGADAEE